MEDLLEKIAELEKELEKLREINNQINNQIINNTNHKEQFNKLSKDKNELKQGLQGIQNKNSIITSKKLIRGV